MSLVQFNAMYVGFNFHQLNKHFRIRISQQLKPVLKSEFAKLPPMAYVFFGLAFTLRLRTQINTFLFHKNGQIVPSGSRDLLSISL